MKEQAASGSKNTLACMTLLSGLVIFALQAIKGDLFIFFGWGTWVTVLTVCLVGSFKGRRRECKRGVLINIHKDQSREKSRCSLWTNCLHCRCASKRYNIVFATIIECVMDFKTRLTAKSRASAANTSVFIWNSLLLIRELITHLG